MIREFLSVVSIGLIAISLVSGCRTRQHSGAVQPIAKVASQSGIAEKSPKVPPMFESFFDSLKRSFTVEELRATADQFFKVHPSFDGAVPRDQWSEIIKLPKEGLDPLPASVTANVISNGVGTITIDYGDKAWNVMAVLIGPADTAETPDPWSGVPPSEFYRRVKWGPGIYVFYAVLPPATPSYLAQQSQRNLAHRQDFLEHVKKSFTAQELREAADQFFQAHPDFEGFVEGKDWPEVFKLKKEAIGRPTFVSVAKDSEGRRGMMVEFAGSFWLEGILIEPPDKAEMQSHLDSRTKFLKWEQGIYVYYSP